MPNKKMSMGMSIILLFIIASSLIFLAYCLHRELNRVACVLYIIGQISAWASLGIILKHLYTATCRDDLTGLWNRKYLYFKLGDELRRADVDNVLSLAILDIDNFKSVNDERGHLFGDAVLKQVALLLQKNIRKDDIIGRWGGEEFIIILPDTENNGAKSVCERIRYVIGSYDFGCSITISVGLASTDRSIQIDELIEKADKALYLAKETKNTVAICSFPSE
ncbi:MAG: GGDEF domain-containing protein [Clostridiales bacterium]|nr:GGDEF domain-containing protein [Clostridiales bacterium]